MITDSRKYVLKWLELKRVIIDERGGLSSPDKRDYLELVDTMWLDYCEQIDTFNRVADKKVKGAPESNLRKALEELISLQMIQRREEIFKKIQFIGTENLELLKTFTKAVTGKSEDKIVGVLAHFLCSIKRKLNDKEVVYHIMPIIYGKQGGGKSLCLQRLFAPLTNLTLDLSLTELTDARFYFALNRNFVVVLDEMAGAAKSDVEKLKKTISSSYNDVRKLGTNIVTKIKQNSCFIGTTNKPVSEIIFDPTGARRFFEIKALDKLDWNVINSIDYVALFQGIDENKEKEYFENVQKDVEKDQEDLIGVDELTAFLDTFKISSGPKEFSAILFYDTYKTWAEENGIKNVINSVWLGRKLKNRGLDSKLKYSHGKTQRVYYINEDSDLLKKTYDPLAAPESKKWN